VSSSTGDSFGVDVTSVSTGIARRCLSCACVKGQDISAKDHVEHPWDGIVD
jgi:hypothetical protein